MVDRSCSFMRGQEEYIMSKNSTSRKILAAFATAAMFGVVQSTNAASFAVQEQNVNNLGYAYAGTAALAEDAKDTKKDNPPIATSPSDCGSRVYEEKKVTPRNCLFLEEPVGGKNGYDLYVVKCTKKKAGWDCDTTLYRGQSLGSNTTSTTYHGPIQAVLTEDKSKPYQGPFTLLYNYLDLIYKYMSGLIVGIAVLFVVIGGIQMTVSNGDQSKFDEGKNRIIKAIVGIILWFTASLMLYTINPTFFSF